MKCIHCANDAKYKDRSDGRCPSCKKRFAFEPQRGDPMTDSVFASAIERVSSLDRVRFNADNVYYEIRRRYRRTLSGKIIGRAVLAGIAIAGSGIASAIHDDSVVLRRRSRSAYPRCSACGTRFRATSPGSRSAFRARQFDALFRR